MKYRSTRGGVSDLSFKDAVMMGLASDGGLLVPDHIPDASPYLDRWDALPYPELAQEIMGLFIDDISNDDLLALTRSSYATFDDERVTPLVKVGDLHVLELFHGPTLAFKDVALQFLGNVFEHILRDLPHGLNILGATSGDTGSAAIAGVRGKSGINIFIMFPEGKTSPVQELQMTSILDANVHNIGVEGSFDDCQAILKAVFSDLEFKAQHHLGAVNSVNWARVLAQVVYYFSAWYQLGKPGTFDVAVPTGNFGNIFAGYLARRMGLPIRRLVLATNSNDILARFFNTGIYERGEVDFTFSPAMDIQVSSNFERYLYYATGEAPGKVSEFMEQFLSDGRAELRFNTPGFDGGFVAGSVSNDDTVATMRRYHETRNYLLDPHTAVGVTVAEQHIDPEVPMVCLSTAHPGKFEDVVEKALPGVEVSHPVLDALKGAQTRKVLRPAETSAIKALIAGQAQDASSS